MASWAALSSSPLPQATVTAAFLRARHPAEGFTCWIPGNPLSNLIRQGLLLLTDEETEAQRSSSYLPRLIELENGRTRA